MSPDQKDETEEQAERGDFEALREDYALKLKARIDSGAKLTDQELRFISQVDDEQADEFPKRLHVQKTKFPRSPAQQAQTQKNLDKINRDNLQTGPKTAEGKSRSSRNAIKHGLYAQSFMSLMKPCLTTCPEYPCSLVTESRVAPGDHCLEKQHFVELLDAVEKAMRSKDFDDLNDQLAIEVAANMDMVRKLREMVVAIGPLVKSEKETITTGKDDFRTETTQREYKLNPALLAIPKLIADMGLTLPAAMLTPQERSRHKIDDKAAENMADKVAKMGRKIAGALKGKPKNEGDA